MSISRRTFLQTSLAGGAALTAFGFDVAPVYAQTQDAEDLAHDARRAAPARIVR